jgi:murein L,D-transpeptidase YcbB/YkuD
VSPAAAADTLYDPLLAAAVERFQARHGLDADGVVGPRTLAALNRPVGERIDQLRASLERGRWLLRGLAGDFVLVNIAGARTYLFRDGVPVWRARSIIGREYLKTPVFRDALRYMELNPTWTVPRSIFLRDLLPRIRREPGYLAEGGFSVLDRQGQRLDPATVDWSLDDPGVTLVQAPGPRNALGQIKFMFPNRFAVYLHDTPDRGLFERADRALSSGCVRIEHPFVLADLIMAGSPDWSPERRQAILASGRTTRVDLPAPLPVLLTYYTAWVEDGEVLFRDDIYGRDGPLLAALDAPLGGRDAAR